VRLLAIADPHLSTSEPKPMTVFGPGWAGHPQAFFDGWNETVRPDDAVIVAGDISWALRLPAALPDLQAIAALPGQKVLLRGNHDYWWPAIGKLRASLPPGMRAIQNDSLVIGETAIAGTRGWVCPGSEGFTEEDERIYRREVERFRLAVASLQGKQYRRLVLALHFPPTNPRFAASGFTEIIESAKPDAVVYGHLHGVHVGRVLREWKGIPLHFVAADAVNFRPRVVLEEA
jgi:predicted phosphohydrolase